MQYAEFERLIHERAATASKAARKSFALDTIGRLHDAVESYILQEFTEPERLLLREVLSGLERKPPATLKPKFQELHVRLCRDPIRAVEFTPPISQLLSAIDSWIGYRTSGDPEHVAQIAINMVNVVDYAIGGEVAEYSIENVLGAPSMVAEYRRQERMLGGGRRSVAGSD